MLNHKLLRQCSHLEPFNICIWSGHFAFKSDLLLFRNTDIHDGFGDHSRGLYNINIKKWLLRLWYGYWGGSSSEYLPVTISLQEVWTPSAWKATVPASSLFRLDNVRACFFSIIVIRQFDPGLNLRPSLVQKPSTSAWLSSTSNVTVSVSCAVVSFRPVNNWIFFTEGKKMKGFVPLVQ